MKTLQILLLGALAGALVAVLGTTAVVRTLNPSAAQVAKQDAANDSSYDPAAPPPFYGSR